MSIPKDKSYPDDSVKCGGCGGHGCQVCEDKGWLTPATHPRGQRCCCEECRLPVPPDFYGFYCGNECAEADA